MTVDKDISVSDFFALSTSMCILFAKVDDFGEEEIRCLAPKNPTNIANIENWDGLIDNKQPEFYDIGINKNKEVFCFVNNEWRPIKK